MTGRGAGYCGMGGGRGWRHAFQATGLTGWQRAAVAVPPLDAAAWELGALKRQAEGLTATLTAINKRIDELEGQPARAPAADETPKTSEG